jgi:hypothetical protein
MVKVCYTFFQLVASSVVVRDGEATRSNAGERGKPIRAAIGIPAILFSNEGLIFWVAS